MATSLRRTRRASKAVAAITALLGVGLALPVAQADMAAAVPAPPPVTLDTSGQHAFVTTISGNAWGWGWDASGQLGRGVANPGVITGEPAPITVQNVRSVATGQRHTAVVTTGGQVYTFGNNSDGELGDGTTTDRAVPTQVGISGVVGAGASCDHTVVVKSDGTVWAWGSNAYGQLGDGTTTDRHTPVQVSGLTNVVAVATGYYCFGSWNLALKSDGTVWAWGKGTQGQLGNGVSGTSLTPVQVSGLTNVVNIGAGWTHSLAVKGDGTVWAWGYNFNGPLGDGTTTNRLTPVQAIGVTNAVAVSGGDYHSVALRADGSVWSWGGNWSGQLGDGTTTDRLTPGASLVNNATAIAAGMDSSAAVIQGGTVVEWGSIPSEMHLQSSPVPVPRAGVAGAQPMSRSQASYPSNECTSAPLDIVNGFIGNVHVLARVAGGAVCVAVDDGTTHLGVKVGNTGAVATPAVDDNQAACDANPATRIFERTVTVGPNNEPVEIDVNQFATEVWVCVKLTNQPGLAKRVVLPASPGSIASIALDPIAPFAYAETPAPAGKVSSTCQQASTGTKVRVVNAQLGDSHVWAYARQNGLQVQLCARVESPVVTQGVYVAVQADGGQTFVTPTLTTDFSACPVNIVSDAGPPPVQLRTSNPGSLPAALCVRVGDVGVRLEASAGGGQGIVYAALDS